MTGPNSNEQSLSKLPALLGQEDQWLSDMEYLRQYQFEEIQLAQFEKKEAKRLRIENSKLKEQLDMVMSHPLFDDASERISVSLDLWQAQKEKVRKLVFYKRLCWVLFLAGLILLSGLFVLQ